MQKRGKVIPSLRSDHALFLKQLLIQPYDQARADNGKDDTHHPAAADLDQASEKAADRTADHADDNVEENALAAHFQELARRKAAQRADDDLNKNLPQRRFASPLKNPLFQGVLLI